MTQKSYYKKQKQPVFSKISLTLIIVAFIVLTIIGSLHINDIDENGSNWGRFALVQASFCIMGVIGTSFLTQGTLFPQKLRKANPNTIINTLIILSLELFIQLFSSLTLSISTTEKALYYVFASIGEEVLFRGCIMEFCRKINLHPILSIGLSAFLFMEIHVNYYGQFSMMLMVFLGGIALATTYFLFQDLTANIFGHFLNNAIAVGINFGRVNLAIISYSWIYYVFIGIFSLFLILYWITYFKHCKMSEKNDFSEKNEIRYMKKQTLISMFLLVFSILLLIMIYKNSIDYFITVGGPKT